MSNLLQLNKTRRDRLSKMLRKLFEMDYKYVRVKSNGLVIFKKSIWSFRKETTTIAELCITSIPARISAYKLAQNMSHIVVTEDMISLVIKSKNYINIIDFLWNEFIKINFPIAQIGFSQSRDKFRKTINTLLFGNRTKPELRLKSNEIKAIALTAQKINQQ
jgi:hypothetical protein